MVTRRWVGWGIVVSFTLGVGGCRDEVPGTRTVKVDDPGRSGAQDSSEPNSATPKSPTEIGREQIILIGNALEPLYSKQKDFPTDPDGAHAAYISWVRSMKSTTKAEMDRLSRIHDVPEDVIDALSAFTTLQNQIIVCGSEASKLEGESTTSLEDLEKEMSSGEARMNALEQKCGRLNRDGKEMAGKFSALATKYKWTQPPNWGAWLHTQESWVGCADVAAKYAALSRENRKKFVAMGEFGSFAKNGAERAEAKIERERARKELNDPKTMERDRQEFEAKCTKERWSSARLKCMAEKDDLTAFVVCEAFTR